MTGGRHFERVDWQPSRTRPPDLSTWPYTIPAVAQVIAEGGFEVPGGVTFLVGENGSGKSTLIEALAASYPRYGHWAAQGNTTGPYGSAEDSELHLHLRAWRARMGSPAGFFLRAEAMHAWFAGIDENPNEARPWDGHRLNARSHGESFLEVLRRRFTDIGVYFLDEPEAALSFRSSLGLVALLDTLRAEGSQVVVATHSPLVASLPGTTLLELGEWGIRPVARYDDLDLVVNWRSYLDSPDRFLRHLLTDP
ncbi:MAG TPA: ATP-binding cassette domain-containing protein [Acidimicrobiia bacterium]|nr:ATP-binding cassette domain-containing protein [Acidimicrobiia bacterium]